MRKFIAKFKELTVQKKLLYLGFIVLIVFVLYSIYWCIFNYVHFLRYDNATVDGYTYTVFDNKFPNFNGNMVVEDEDGNSAIVWVKPFKGAWYGVEIRLYEGDSEVYAMVKVDGELQAKDGEKQYIVEEEYEMFNSLVSHAKSYFKLD